MGSIRKRRKSDGGTSDALAYSAGWNAAADGDITGHGEAVGLSTHPAFIEGAAAYKEQTAASARTGVPGNPSFANLAGGVR